MRVLLYFLLSLCTVFAEARTFPYPGPESNIIGSDHLVEAKLWQTFDEIAEEQNVSYRQLRAANPQYPDNTLPLHAKVLVPEAMALPQGLHHGVVINVPELRIYFFPPKHHEVVTAPIGIGTGEAPTPKGRFYILEKLKNPVWHPSPEIMKLRAAIGKPLPAAMGPGKYNPLGHYALRLSNWSYMIHGTNHPDSVGKQSSSGCIHLYSEDIAVFYQRVPFKAPVVIQQERIQIGYRGNTLYLKSNPPLEHAELKQKDDFTHVQKNIRDMAKKRHAKNINWETVFRVLKENRSVLTQISD